MKKVTITYEAVVDNSKIKTEENVMEEGYEDIEDAIITDGLEGVINGSYEYSVHWEITDVESTN